MVSLTEERIRMDNGGEIWNRGKNIYKSIKLKYMFDTKITS